ncbi:winged helix-turn-helix transcriptional regulator [Streptomyces sp. P1-3]|uniref:winged helix-turn-helix transcriptional regulator n=1 Tax=Streptomyces sp. P1-3 TaxID=3421658 RepID=UPI003D36249B
MPHRSYDQYCAVAGALDAVGERWSLLIVRKGLVERRRLERLGNAMVYELTSRGLALCQVVDALADWGLDALGAPRPTDAVRRHWFTERVPSGQAVAERPPGLGTVR